MDVTKEVPPCSKMSFPHGSSTANKKINIHDFKWLHKKERISAAGISFADLIGKAKNQTEGIMSRLIHYFKNRQAKKQIKIRIKEWLFSERAEEAIPIAAIPVKR